MPWKKPNRPDNSISQSYNDGYVIVYSVSDEAEPGYQPVEKLERKILLHYEERKVGLHRHYEARQNQIRVERVIRVQHTGKVTNQDVVRDERGRLYRIDLVQMAPDVYPPSADLTLVAYEQQGEEPGECQC